MLNGGRIDDACTGTLDPTATSFRDRHLLATADGFIGARKWLDAGVGKTLRPVLRPRRQRLGLQLPGGRRSGAGGPGRSRCDAGLQDQFRNRRRAAGLVTHRSRAAAAASARQCFDGAAGGADANAEVSALVGLAPALTQTPAAAMTVRGRPSIPWMHASSTPTPAASPSTPAARSIRARCHRARRHADVGGRQLVAWPATPRLHDRVTPSAALTGGEMMFLAAFGMPPAAFRVQPAVVRMTCVPIAPRSCSSPWTRSRAACCGSTATWVWAAAPTLDLGTAAAPARCWWSMAT